MSKPKRKINPRRRLLLRLLIITSVIVIISLIVFERLQPTGAQIVYIAPDENGREQVWLADVTNPEKPQQLTSLQEDEELKRIYTMPESSAILYQFTLNSDLSQTYLIDRTQNIHRQLLSCSTDEYLYTACNFLVDGNWIAYQERLIDTDGTPYISVNMMNVITNEKRVIFESPDLLDPTETPAPRWLADVNLLVFGTASDADTQTWSFYSVEQDRIISTLTIPTLRIPPYFSPDGSRYITYTMEQTPSSGNIPHQVRYVWDRNNASNWLSRFETGYNINFQYWLSDNEHIIGIDIGEQVSDDSRNVWHNISLYNTTTGEVDTFLVIDSPLFTGFWTDLSHDGSRMVYTYNNSGDQSGELPQIMLFDLEQRQNEPLPLSGWQPQWVNGGR